MDDKFNPSGHPAFDQTADGKGKPYVHLPNRGGGGQAQPYQLLAPKALSYYEGLKKKGGNVHIDRIAYEDFALLADVGTKRRFTSKEEPEQKEKPGRQQDNEPMYAQEEPEQGSRPVQEELHTGQRQAAKGAVHSQQARGRRAEGGDTIMNRMAQWEYSREQKDELHRMAALGMPVKTILAVFYPETDVRKMREVRKIFETVHHSDH